MFCTNQLTEWYEFNSKVTTNWEASASTAVIATAIDGPVGSFISVAGLLYCLYTSIDIEYSGRYKFEGSHVRGEYTAKIYGGDKFVTTVNWRGYR